jgi:acyl dehydratase
MTQQSEIEYDRSVMGVEVEVGRFDLTLEDIRAFCAAIGETNPLYTDEAAAAAGPYGGIVAPPAFIATVQVRQGLDPKVRYGNSTFHAGQRCAFFAPMRPGDSLTAMASVHDIFEKTGRSGGMLFVVRRVTFRNQRDEVVATVDNSYVHRRIERE